MTKLHKVRFTPVLDTSQYTAGDVLFATTEIIGFIPQAGKAILRYVKVTDKADQKNPIGLVFFKSNVSLGAFNGAPDITDANGDEVVSYFPIVATDYIDLGGVSVAVPQATAFPTQLFLPLEAGVNGSTSVWVAGIVTSGTPTYAAPSLVFDFWVETAMR